MSHIDSTTRYILNARDCNKNTSTFNFFFFYFTSIKLLKLNVSRILNRVQFITIDNIKTFLNS